MRFEDQVDAFNADLVAWESAYTAHAGQAEIVARLNHAAPPVQGMSAMFSAYAEKPRHVTILANGASNIYERAYTIISTMNYIVGDNGGTYKQLVAQSKELAKSEQAFLNAAHACALPSSFPGSSSTFPSSSPASPSY